MNYTLKMFNTGQVTFEEEKDWTLLIRPILAEGESWAVYYEDGKSFWVHFPESISPQELIKDIER